MKIRFKKTFKVSLAYIMALTILLGMMSPLATADDSGDGSTPNAGSGGAAASVPSNEGQGRVCPDKETRKTIM